MSWEVIINAGIGGITGAVAGGIVSWFFSKEKDKKENSEKIYAPLLSEFRKNLRVVEEKFSDRIVIQEWERITQKDHLTHKIKEQIKNELEYFYNEVRKSYKDKYYSAREKINEKIKKELRKRSKDEIERNSSISNLIEGLLEAFIAGKILNNRSYLKGQFDSVNNQLEMRYDDLNDFFEKNLELLNDEEEIKEIREERHDVIKSIEKIIPLLKKELG